MACPVYEKDLRSTITGSSFFVCNLRDEVLDINAKLEELQKELLKRANAKEEYNDLADEIDHLREVKQKVLIDKAQNESLKQRMIELSQSHYMVVPYL